MDNEKLLIGGVIVILLVLAIPIIGPMVIDTSGYDPVADSQKLDTMNRAIKNYANTNQQYPPTLHYLVPDFLDAVPLTSTNLQFQYDARTGTVTNPSAPPPKPEGPNTIRIGGGGGVSPATDAMTGLSVSQELNY